MSSEFTTDIRTNGPEYPKFVLHRRHEETPTPKTLRNTNCPRRVLGVIGSCIAYIGQGQFGKGRQEAAMDGDYVFLCGVMWCAYGLQDAASELLRAAKSLDPDLSALALAMLAQRREYRPVN